MKILLNKIIYVLFFIPLFSFSQKKKLIKFLIQLKERPVTYSKLLKHQRVGCNFIW